MECFGVLPTTQFSYRKGLGAFYPLLFMSHTLQSALESVQEARIVQINFSAAIDTVNHQGIIYISSAVLVFEVLCCLYRKPSISTTFIITVELFVTTARLARGQTLVIMVKTAALGVKIRPASENSGHCKNLILQFNPMYKKIVS